MEGMPRIRPETDPSEVADLRRAVAVLSREVETLADRAARLTLAVERLAPVTEPAVTAKSATAPAPGVEREDAETVPYRVVVSPVSELALVAVAETTLRGMPQVRQVTETIHSDRQASFELELVAGTDVAEPLRAALPVPFQIESSTGTELIISLRPVWGPAASA